MADLTEVRTQMIALRKTLVFGSPEFHTATFLLQTLNTTITHGYGRIENVLEGVRCQAKNAKGDKRTVYLTFFEYLGVKP